MIEVYAALDRRGSRIAIALLLALAAAPAEAQAPWSQADYDALVVEFDTAYAEAQRLEAAGDPASEALFTTCIELQQQAIDMLVSGVESGAVELSDAVRLTLLDSSWNVIALMTNVDQCDTARSRLGRLRSEGHLLPADIDTELEALDARVSACDERLAAAAAAEEEPQSTTVTAEPELEGVAIEPEAEETTAELGAEVTEAEGVATEEALPTEVAITESRIEEGSASPLPWVLIGTGAALGVGALIYDVTLAGDRDEFDLLRDACEQGTAECDRERGLALQDDLDTGRVVILALGGAAIVGIAVGAVLLLTGEDEPSARELTLVPALGPALGDEGFGAVLSGDF